MYAAPTGRLTLIASSIKPGAVSFFTGLPRGNPTFEEQSHVKPKVGVVTIAPENEFI
jgi:hypothetical protein